MQRPGPLLFAADAHSLLFKLNGPTLKLSCQGLKLGFGSRQGSDLGGSIARCITAEQRIERRWVHRSSERAG